MIARHACRAALVALLGAFAASAIQAQPGFPARPITMVVPLPAGGTADLLCRLAAERRRSILGQQVVVENRAGGAGGRVGTESVLRARARRLHAVVRAATHLQHHASVVPKSAFDTRTMEPVSVLATYPLTLLGRADSAGERSARIHRLCESQSRQGQLRPPGQGQYRPPARRTPDAQGRFQDDGNSVSWQRAGHQRSACRTASRSSRTISLPTSRTSTSAS